MRKRIIPLILRCLIHLENTTPPIHISSTSRTSHSSSGGARSIARGNTTVPDRRSSAALPADAAAFKDLFTTIEQYVQFGVADDATFTIDRVLHDFDVLAFEFEQLGRHLRYSLSSLASFGIATDWSLEFT
jgi:hypothetical protein